MISSQCSGPSVRGLFARTQTETDGLGFTGVPIRILIVDDIEAWHGIYVGVLRRHPNWRIVGVARNSVEAVQKTRELKPDVVLLDVGLGRTDRLEAVQKIREASPDSHLLLLGTGESSRLAEIALSVGAYGYVSKRNVVLDLVPAMEALAKGTRFDS
jgi:DNA-binding NarL/FixJ family response regulator